MALAPGTSLGHYDVTALLGEGGMGQVWQATDTQLNRQVALKILPDAFADDPDRLARFTREAQILASLNHPNIAAIHGIEESEGTRALVLELVEGPTLADRIAQGAIPLDEALPIAKQIAEALEAAHEAGVIHRDLKPANIKVRDDGTVKVLDFGLAKAVQPDVPAAVLSDSPTVTATVGGTRQGVILGTAAYMSPEQARGKPLDRRTDIWSFGCVLYEMLAGRAAYVGNTLSDTLVSILDRDPDWAALPPDTPRWLRTLLQRCLRKQTTRRLRHIGDAQLELDEAPAEPQRRIGRSGRRLRPRGLRGGDSLGCGCTACRDRRCELDAEPGTESAGGRPHLDPTTPGTTSAGDWSPACYFAQRPHAGHTSPRLEPPVCTCEVWTRPTCVSFLKQTAPANRSSRPTVSGWVSGPTAFCIACR